jgi:hypothetical protein
MNHLNAMQAVPMPPSLAALPRDVRGYPITYTVLRAPDGRVDFTTTDPLAWVTAYKLKLCGMCGKPLGRTLWFIGGPVSMHTRAFFDHPMHDDCARYALVVCPYLAMPKYLGAKARAIPEAQRIELASSNATKPRLFGLAWTRKYKVIQYQGDVLLQAGAWKHIEWWKDGAKIEVLTPEQKQTIQDAKQIQTRSI